MKIDTKKLVKCYICGIEFYGVRNRKDRICKKCVLDKCREYYQDNKEKKIRQSKENREMNKEIISIKKRLKYLENRESVILKVKKYYQDNKEKIKKSGKIYRQENKENA